MIVITQVVMSPIYVQLKPRKETCRKPTKARRETRSRLTDAELLVLPPFGYDLLSRERFDKSFKDVIIGGIA